MKHLLIGAQIKTMGAGRGNLRPPSTFRLWLAGGGAPLSEAKCLQPEWGSGSDPVASESDPVPRLPLKLGVSPQRRRRQLPAMPGRQLVQQVQKDHRIRPPGNRHQDALPRPKEPALADGLVNGIQ